ncbi:unnamed protein product [Sphagnum jensenii]|uniref:Uncharacterized protein n=1 Tax=Sphagnum jensenii TaxID=128206 RepID=A0ABP1C139_9BRYO
MGCEIVRYKKQRKELMVYEQVGDQEELIPGLPNDVALQCLLRIPVQAGRDDNAICVHGSSSATKPEDD